jgi:hypothetical protein
MIENRGPDWLCRKNMIHLSLKSSKILNLLKIISHRTAKCCLRDAVPILKAYGALKSQFDWLVDGSVSHLINENLPRELQNLELYLRYRLFKCHSLFQCNGSGSTFILAPGSGTAAELISGSGSAFSIRIYRGKIKKLIKKCKFLRQFSEI